MSSIEALRELLERRIVVLDGAMGTMAQSKGLTGCYDDLARTDPEAIEDIHLQFLRSGADLFEQGVRRVPVIASVTIPDKSGRTLSGQTVEAFYNSISHVELLAVSINCALGADDMRPHVAELARIARTRVACYPNAGLPN